MIAAKMQLDQKKLQNFLDQKNIDWPLYILECIDSTNLEAFRLMEEVKSNFFVLAKKQTAGRGTHGRVWESEAIGNLNLTLGFNEELDYQRVHDLGFRLNSSACKKLSKLFHRPFELKWPNDILADGKKLCGMLLESKIKNNRIEKWVLGFGMNVNGTEAFWSEEVKARAITLKQISGVETDLNFLASELIAAFLETYRIFSFDSPVPIAVKHNA